MLIIINTNKIKKDFPIFQNHPRLAYLDNAATTQKPQAVINTVSDFYSKFNANVHRGIYKLSEKATMEYETAREKTRKFINARSVKEIIFVRNTTEGINLVARSFLCHSGAEQSGAIESQRSYRLPTALRLSKSSKMTTETILTSLMEHHSNIVPWQLVVHKNTPNQNKYGSGQAENTKIPSCAAYSAKVALATTVGQQAGENTLEVINLTEDFRLDLDDYKKKLEQFEPALVAITHASNVLGTINPIKKIIKLAHSAGARVLIDGAQAVPHTNVDVKNLDADFYVFSGHKMLGPTGIGVLYAKQELLKKMSPFLGGGDMIKKVTLDSVDWNELPWKFEAGTPNIAGAIALGAAIDYLNNIGLENIYKHGQELGSYALERLNNINGLKLYGPKTMNNRLAIFSFVINNLHAHDLAQLLNEENIAIRAGHQCTMPLHEQIIKKSATARASFYIYNTREDVDKLVEGLKKTIKILK